MHNTIERTSNECNYIEATQAMEKALTKDTDRAAFALPFGLPFKGEAEAGTSSGSVPLENSSFIDLEMKSTWN